MNQRAWHLENPGVLDGIKRELAEFYPLLHVYVVKEIVVIQGSFPVEHDGKELDRFKIQILFPSKFPKTPPFVFESGGRIPRTLERHVYPKTGNCCLFYGDAFRIRHPEGMAFLDFLRGPVRDYFISQLAVENGKPWPFGELGHSKEGIIEFYEEELGVKGEQAVLDSLACLSYGTLKGHHKCPCGSGRRLRDCHRLKLDGLRERIPSQIAIDALNRLKS